MGLLFDFLKGKKNAEPTLSAYAQGTVIPMEAIPDQVFSQGIMGFCCGIEPTDGKVYAPADGTISQTTDTLHAVGLTVDGMELLIHAGVDTVEMNGAGFTNAVQEGQAVKKGDLLLTMDLEQVRAAGHGTVVILAVTNSDDFAAVELTASGKVSAGDGLMNVRK